VKKEHYAIEKIGSKKPVYVIKKVINGLVIPVNGKPYKTVEKAQAVANELGLNIEKVGDLYEIL
jgi:hypothetical protein